MLSGIGLMKLLPAIAASTASRIIRELSLEVVLVRNWGVLWFGVCLVFFSQAREGSLVPRETPFSLIVRRQLWCLLIVSEAPERASSYWSPSGLGPRADCAVEPVVGGFCFAPESPALLCASGPCFCRDVFQVSVARRRDCIGVRRGKNWANGWMFSPGFCVCSWNAGTVMFPSLFGGGNPVRRNDTKLNLCT